MYKKCIHNVGNNKILNIDSGQLFTANSSNCWGNSDRIQSSTNNIGIIDTYKDNNNNNKYVKKCCKVNSMIIPRSDIAGNEVFVGECKIIKDDGSLEDDLNPANQLTASHICNINSSKPNNIVSSPETTNFCKAYKCCSNINISD